MDSGTSPKWRPANNGAGKRIYFLYLDNSALPASERYYLNCLGDLIRFASYETAKRKADRLNREMVNL